MKQRVIAFLVTFLMVMTAHASHKVTGVAFIHGKGGPDLATKVGAWEYWGTDMIARTTKEFTIPHTVIGYDGTTNMVKAAETASKQLYDFIQRRGINDLVVNAHSMGGVVMRWIYSNADDPTIPGNKDLVFSKIKNVTRWVNTISSPHSGSEVADLADTLYQNFTTSWIVWLIGQNTESTWNLTTTSMAYYNEHVLYGTQSRPDLGVRFYNIAGDGIWNDWYSFHMADYRLYTISSLTGFPGANDGVVTVKSAQSVGKKWFVTAANHYHNRRSDYEPLGDTLAKDF